MKKINYLIAMLIVLAFSCSKNDEVISSIDDITTLGKVSFNLQTVVEAKAKTAAKTDNPNPTGIIVSVIDENNEAIFENQTFALTNFNGSYLTESIELLTGSYTLTEFNVVNSDNEVILTAPIIGSELAEFTSTTLPMNFVVTGGNTTNVVPPVLWVDVEDIPTVLPEVSEGNMRLYSSFTTNQESIKVLENYRNLINLGDFTFTIGEDIDDFIYLVKISSSSIGEKLIETFKFDDPNVHIDKILSIGDYLVASNFSGHVYVIDYINQSYKKYEYIISTRGLSSINNVLYTASGNQLFKSEDLGQSFQLVNDELNFNMWDESSMIYHNNAIYVVGSEGFAASSLYKSTDEGISFENILDGVLDFDTKFFEVDNSNLLIGEYSEVSLFNTTNNTIDSNYSNTIDDGEFLSFTSVDGEYRFFYENNIYDSSVFSNEPTSIGTGILSLYDVITSPDQQQVFGVSNEFQNSKIYFNLR